MILYLCLSLLFAVLFIKSAAITLHLAWGVTKIIFGLLIIMCLPAMILLYLFCAGFFMIIPVIALLAIYVLLTKTGV